MVNFDTTFLDYPSPDDIAVVVIMSGCSHSCPGCQNPNLQKIYDEKSEEYIGEIIACLSELCSRNETKKVVLTGGDCLHPSNRKLTKEICFYLGETLDICIYTGYDIEEVKEMGIVGFKYIKCGKFDCNNMQTPEKTDEYIQFVNKTQNLYDSNYKQLSVDGKFFFNSNTK